LDSLFLDSCGSQAVFPHRLLPTRDEPLVGVTLTLVPVARLSRLEPENDEQQEQVLEGRAARTHEGR
jgi:hypothetical protein